MCFSICTIYWEILCLITEIDKGFCKSYDVIKPEKEFVIVPVSGLYPIKQNVTICEVADFLKLIQ